jgi:hypothetical protein
MKELKKKFHTEKCWHTFGEYTWDSDWKLHLLDYYNSTTDVVSALYIHCSAHYAFSVSTKRYLATAPQLPYPAAVFVDWRFTTPQIPSSTVPVLAGWRSFHKLTRRCLVAVF